MHTVIRVAKLYSSTTARIRKLYDQFLALRPTCVMLTLRRLENERRMVMMSFYSDNESMFPPPSCRCPGS